MNMCLSSPAPNAMLSKLRPGGLRGANAWTVCVCCMGAARAAWGCRGTAPDDVCDAHEAIVHCHTEVVDRQAG